MKNRNFSLLCLAFLFLPFFSEAQQPDSSQPLDLTTENGVLKGTLLLPASKKPVPLVLLISGSGPTDRDGNNPVAKNNSLKMVAEGLLANGIASVRFDKRGIAESKAAMVSESELRFDTYVEDAAKWIQTLKQDKRFSQIIVLGHSEGSLIGMISAAKAKADGVISLAGPGQSADKVIRTQLQSQPAMVKDLAFPILDSLTAGKTVSQVNPMLASLFRPSVQPYLISWFKYHPQQEIKALTVPILLVQGDHDLQVPVDEAHKLKEAAPSAKMVILPGMDHVLKSTSADRTENIKTYSSPDLPLHPALIPALVSFVKTIK